MHMRNIYAYMRKAMKVLVNERNFNCITFYIVSYDLTLIYTVNTPVFEHIIW